MSIASSLLDVFSGRNYTRTPRSGLMCPFHSCLRKFAATDPVHARFTSGSPVADPIIARSYDLGAVPQLLPWAQATTSGDRERLVQQGAKPICPTCHSRLVNTDSEGGYVALLGERGAGKTAFLANMINYSREHGSRFGLALHPHVTTDPADVTLDKSALDQLASLVEDPTHTLPAATDPIHQPRSLSFEAVITGHDGNHRSRHLLVIDSAGERQVQGREQHCQYIRGATGGLYLFIDPASVPGFARAIQMAAPRPFASQAVVAMLVDAFNGVPPEKVPPIMVAISKADLLTGPGQPLSSLGAAVKLSEHQANRTWNRESGAQYSRAIERILNSNGFDTTFLNLRFPRIIYTTVSSTGGGQIVRDQSEQRIENSGEPWRAHDFFYFMGDR